MSLPKDPFILLSYVNTQLRDFYPTLSLFCEAENISEEELCSRLAAIDYHYEKELHQFR